MKWKITEADKKDQVQLALHDEVSRVQHTSKGSTNGTQISIGCTVGEGRRGGT